MRVRHVYPSDVSSLTSKLIDLDGLRLHYLDGGEGEPVLLLHGWPTSAFLYRNVAPHLAAAGRRVIALDLPGFGKSDKPLDASYSFRFFDRTLNSFLDALGLLNTLVYPRPSWAVVAFVVASYTPLLKECLVSPAGLRMAMKVGTCSPEGSSEDVVAGVQEPFVDKAARKALLKSAHGLHPGGMKTIAQKLKTTTVPVRIVYGTEDRILPDVARTMKRVAKELSLPEDRVTALDGCDHFLQEDRPDEVGRLLADFFG